MDNFVLRMQKCKSKPAVYTKALKQGVLFLKVRTVTEKFRLKMILKEGVSI